MVWMGVLPPANVTAKWVNEGETFQLLSAPVSFWQNHKPQRKSSGFAAAESVGKSQITLVCSGVWFSVTVTVWLQFFLEGFPQG